jgi:hypothetical protein
MIQDTVTPDIELHEKLQLFTGIILGLLLFFMIVMFVLTLSPVIPVPLHLMGGLVISRADYRVTRRHA